MTDRDAMLRKLAWSDLPLDALADSQVEAIHTYVERELARAHHCHTPGTRLVKKERRLGRTNRLGWRWVAYVGPVGDAHEVGVCTTRTAAFRVAKRHHAVYFADFARSQIAGGA